MKINSNILLKILGVLLTAGVLAFIIISLIYYNAFGSNGLSTSSSDWGIFGDFFGGVLNPIFGFFTFMGLLFTIALQSRELEETRSANDKAQDFQKAQTKLLIIQNENFSKTQKLNDLDKALKMQAEFVDEEILVPFSEFFTNPPSTIIFRERIRQFRQEKELPSLSLKYKHRKFGKASRLKAELCVVLLGRLGLLLQRYDEIQTPNSSPIGAHAWYYTNTWRFRYYELVKDLNILGVKSATKLLEMFMVVDPNTKMAGT